MSLTGKRYTDDFKTQMIELYNSGQGAIDSEDITFVTTLPDKAILHF
jgi:hypothetical protein